MRKFGLIGYPLTHSFSKKYFSEKFEKEEVTDSEYENYQLHSIFDYQELLSLNPGLEGLNVTVPYKEKVIPFLDKLSEAAAEIGAVNCIRFVEGLKMGYNTDVIGFKNSLLPLLTTIPKRGLILGTGGASKAVAYVLNELGIACQFVSRRPVANGFTYGELTEEVIRNHQLIVNTSPVGTFPDVESKPDIPYHFLGKQHILHDLVYNPAETLFLSLGKQQGAIVKNGYDMLVGQAEASWEIWNRVD